MKIWNAQNQVANCQLPLSAHRSTAQRNVMSFLSSCHELWRCVYFLIFGTPSIMLSPLPVFPFSLPWQAPPPVLSLLLLHFVYKNNNTSGTYSPVILRWILDLKRADNFSRHNITNRSIRRMCVCAFADNGIAYDSGRTHQVRFCDTSQPKNTGHKPQRSYCKLRSISGTCAIRRQELKSKLCRLQKIGLYPKTWQEWNVTTLGVCAVQWSKTRYPKNNYEIICNFIKLQ